MSKLRSIIVFLLCLHSIAASAQQKQGANWLFGEGVLLNFANSQPKVTVAPSNGPTFGKATISDINGNLLFSTSVGDPYTRQILPFGNYASMPHRFPSGRQLLSPLEMIVQNPGNPNIYNVFLFYHYTQGFLIDTTYLYMGEVDMTLNNGFGDVVIAFGTFKLLQKNAGIKIAALQHSNNRDVWILTIDRTGTNFSSYLLSQSGISLPIITPTTRILTEAIRSGGTIGRLKSSPNSELFAINTNDKFELFNFDRNTGIPSYQQTLQLPALDPNVNAFSCAFSPDNKMFYAGTADSINFNNPIQPQTSYLYQFDLSAPSSAAVQSSRTLINTFTNTNGVYDMQLAMDGKIYLSCGPEHQGSNYLSRIKCPNLPSAGCNFRYNEIDLLGKKSGFNLPSLNQIIFKNAGILQAQAIKDTICEGDSVQLSAYGAGAERFQWQAANGLIAPADTLANPFVKPTQTTTFTVTGSSLCASHTALVTVVVLPKPAIAISGSGSVCPQVQGVWYKAHNPQQITWGVKGGIIATTSRDSISVNWGNASNTAMVWALPRNMLGCPGDTVFFPVKINVILATETPKGADTLCLASAQNISYQLHATSGSVYTWSVKGGSILNGQGTATVKVNWNQAGVGKLWVQEESQTSTSLCRGLSDTLRVLIYSSPTSALEITGPKQVFTFAENQVYTIQNPEPNSTYSWQISGGEITAGQGTRQITVNWDKAGMGILEATETNQHNCAGNKATFSVEISGKPLPIFYNIITPNNDHKNDAFVIGNLKWYAENELVIYNRWGIEVFRKSNYQNTWPAETLSSGIYYYYFKTKEQNWKGWLEIVK